jgi:acyl-[acyl carrier protein]--UDP-N-acetylglucosamine O-acyltransferase
MNDFKLLVGSFLGGTQWLNIFLNALGANIHPTAIVADIDCIDDPELVTVDQYVHVDQRARVQVIVSRNYHFYRLIYTTIGKDNESMFKDAKALKNRAQRFHSIVTILISQNIRICNSNIASLSEMSNVMILV